MLKIHSLEHSKSHDASIKIIFIQSNHTMVKILLLKLAGLSKKVPQKVFKWVYTRSNTLAAPMHWWIVQSQIEVWDGTTKLLVWFYSGPYLNADWLSIIMITIMLPPQHVWRGYGMICARLQDICEDAGVQVPRLTGVQVVCGSDSLGCMWSISRVQVDPIYKGASGSFSQGCKWIHFGKRQFRLHTPSHPNFPCCTVLDFKVGG